LALLSVLFGALALILAMMGLSGTFSYLVTHWQREFGVRMALVAEPASIFALVMRGLIAVLARGLVAGALISLAAGASTEVVWPRAARCDDDVLGSWWCSRPWPCLPDSFRLAAPRGQIL
jgi:hypothetical protein